MFLKYSFKFAVKCKSHLYSPIRNATFVRDVYKMINYTAPFSMSEKELVLKRLNSYTVTELGAHLTKAGTRLIYTKISFLYREASLERSLEEFYLFIGEGILTFFKKSIEFF